MQHKKGTIKFDAEEMDFILRPTNEQWVRSFRDVEADPQADACTGVVYMVKDNLYRVQIRLDAAEEFTRTHYLGQYTTEKEARRVARAVGWRVAQVIYSTPYWQRISGRSIEIKELKLPDY